MSVAEVVTDIRAPALNQMSCELAPNARALRLVEVWRKVREVRVEQAQERPERIFVAAVRCCCHDTRCRDASPAIF